MKNDASRHPAHVLAPGDLEPAADLLKCLGHPQRLMLVCALMKGARAVSELERELAIRQPSLSQHLGILRDAGVIAAQRRAKSVIYRISDARAAAVVDVLGSPSAASRTAVLPLDQAVVLKDAIGKGPSAAPRTAGEAAVFARVRPSDHA